MIYFVVAQIEDSGEWKLFGPWDYVEGADSKISELDKENVYSQLELARVLTEEDSATKNEWLEADRHKPRKALVLRYPEHWPKRYNACTDPCDMIEGPCACGGWHSVDEQWVLEMIINHGNIKE